MTALLAQAAWSMGDVAPMALIAFAIGSAIGFERTRRNLHRPAADRRPSLRQRLQRER